MPTKLTYCKDCKTVVLCLGGNDHEIQEYEHEDGSHYYACGTCLQNGHASALGSIVHWCQDMMGMFSGECKVSDDDITRALKEVFADEQTTVVTEGSS